MASQWIDIPTTDGTFDGYLALPRRTLKAGDKSPAVLIIQEIFGVNAHIRSIADQYALDGYVALAPDLFWRTQPRVELSYEGADREKGIELMKKTNVELAAADIGAAASVLRGRSETGDKVAAIGFCFGGLLAYLASARGTLDVAVSYYGGGIQQRLEVADKVTQPILFHYAEQDQGIPPEAVEQVKERFAERSNAEFYQYRNAEHGFNCSERSSYNQRAAALAHGRTLIFLDHYNR